jgi:hypothetical protein
MARLSPAQKLRRILNVIRAWERDAPGRTFWGHSLAQFKAAVQPSLDAHANVADLRKQMRVALIERNLADDRSMQLVYHLGLGVAGDPAYGMDSHLYEEFGRTRETVRRSKIAAGRRRKRKA